MDTYYIYITQAQYSRRKKGGIDEVGKGYNKFGKEMLDIQALIGVGFSWSEGRVS